MNGAPVADAGKKKKPDQKPADKKAAERGAAPQPADASTDQPDWVEDGEQAKLRQEREAKEKELEQAREKEKEASQKEDARKRKERDNSITAEDITAIFKRAFPKEELDDVCLCYISIII